MKTVEYIAPAIKCGGCAETITTALRAAPGVDDVLVDVTAKRVAVQFDEDVTDDDRLRAVLAGAGFAAV